MNEYQVFKSGAKKGQPKTLTDRVVRYLVEGLKMREDISKSRYRQFTSTTGARYFVGKAGAIRTGRTASDSISISNRIYRIMAAWEFRLQATVDKCNKISTEAEKNVNFLDGVIHEPA